MVKGRVWESYPESRDMARNYLDKGEILEGSGIFALTGPSFHDPNVSPLPSLTDCHPASVRTPPKS